MQKDHLISIAVLVVIFITVSLVTITSLQRQLDDCRFECNHLQTKLHWLQELNDYISAMEQILPPIVLAKLKTAAQIIKDEKHKAYERFEQPIITEEEKK